MTWKEHVWRFFSPPAYTGELSEVSRVALLNVTLNISLVALVLISWGNLLGHNVPMTAVALNLFGIVMTLGMRVWLRRGHVKSVGIATLGITYIFLTISNITLGTIRTPTASTYILLVAIGGILYGRRGTLITAGLSSLAILGLIVGQNAGLLPGPDLTVGIAQWISYTVFFYVAGLLTSYALHTIQQALHNAHAELERRREAEAALREQEAFLRAITDNTQEMVTLVSLDSTLQFASAAFRHTLGYDPQEMIGRSGFDLLHPDDAAVLQGRLSATLAHGRPKTLETFRVRHNDGRYIWVEASAQFVQNQGGVSGIVSVFRDVTAQQENEAQIRLLSQAVEASPVSIIMADVDAQIIYVNPEFTRVTGYTFAEVNGRNPRLLQSGETPRETYTLLWDTILSGQTWSGEFVNRRKDGRLYWESAFITPIASATGEITHFLAVKEDVTARKQMETALRRRNDALAALYTITLDILSHRTLEDLLPHLLDHAASLLDAPYGEIMLLEDDKLVVQAFTPNQPFLAGERVGPEEARLSWQSVRTREPAILADYATWPDRRERYVHTGIHAVADFPILHGDRCLGVLAMGRDKPDYPFDEEHVQTGRLLAQLAALALDNARLFAEAQMELAERKQAEEYLLAANTALKERNEDLDAFAHTVAHDLKNPMGIIVGFTELLLTSHASLTEDHLQSVLQAMANSAQKANSIIDSLLLLASVHRQDVAVGPVVMSEVVAEALYRLANAAAGAQVEVREPETWPLVLAYAPWVEEVWVNYLSNALKYGGRPSQVVVSCRRLPDGQVRFAVADNGPGLTAVQQSQLFTQFERLGKQNVQGHGLGLSIVSRIVEKLGGCVGVESELGQGSVFYFTLPSAEV